MCGGGGEDNSAQVAQIEAQAAREAREAEEARRRQERADFDSRLSGAFGSGVDDAEQFFASMGLDPAQYAGSIQKKANSTRSSVPLLDSSPGSYFANLGQQVYDTETGAQRGKKMRAIDQIAPTGFSTKRIDNTADDATIEAILSEQFGSAENYIRNLLDRGVITTSGFDSARRNLEGQRGGASGRLNEIGMGILEGGRGSAENIINDARSFISNENLGGTYDPYAVGNDLNTYFMDFFNNLGTKFRAQAPTNLFDTAGLAGIAGAAQGAGNTVFDPAALAGALNKPQEDDPQQTLNPF